MSDIGYDAKPLQYYCPKHGDTDFHVNFRCEKSGTNETFCLHCMLELLKEKLQPIQEAG